MSEYIVVHGIRVAKDFTPETFGRLTTIGPRFRLRQPSGRTDTFQVCQCECGEVKVLRLTNLNNKTTNSCGCLHRDRIRETCATHGMSNTVEYGRWMGMIGRCYDVRHTSYPRYGGRGITVCERWLKPNGQGFLNFLADLGPIPTTKHSLDKKENDQTYCPENCRWATRKEQDMNKSTTVYIEFEGIADTLDGWAARTGTQLAKLRRRFSKKGVKPGWTVRDALYTKENKEYPKTRAKRWSKTPRTAKEIPKQ